ncbi:MAG: hypothetical protein WD851_02720 [Pirellulales bacterium]
MLQELLRQRGIRSMLAVDAGPSQVDSARLRSSDERRLHNLSKTNSTAVLRLIGGLLVLGLAPVRIPSIARLARRASTEKLLTSSSWFTPARPSPREFIVDSGQPILDEQHVLTM